jgi:hypothetical protein
MALQGHTNCCNTPEACLAGHHAVTVTLQTPQDHRMTMLSASTTSLDVFSQDSLSLGGCTMQYSTVQYSTAVLQYRTSQCITVQSRDDHGPIKQRGALQLGPASWPAAATQRAAQPTHRGRICSSNSSRTDTHGMSYCATNSLYCSVQSHDMSERTPALPRQLLQSIGQLSLPTVGAGM